MSVQGKKRIQVQIDKTLADEVNLIFKELGLNQTVVITAFYKRIVADGGLPFKLKVKEKKKTSYRYSKPAEDLPVKKLSTKEEVDAWFKDVEQYY